MAPRSKIGRRKFLKLSSGILVPVGFNILVRRPRAQVVIPGAIMRPIAAAGGCNTVSGSLLFETLEGPGYLNPGNWSESLGGGTITDDYTGTVLAGSYSLFIENSAGTGTTVTRNTAPASATGTLYFFFLFRPLVISAQTRIFVFENSMGTEVCAVDIKADGALIINNGTANATTTGVMSMNTTYFVWGFYAKGTGADGLAYIAFSTTGTRPTSGPGNYAEVTTGSMTTDVTDTAVKITNNGGQSSAIWDTIIVDDAQIPDNPCNTP